MSERTTSVDSYLSELEQQISEICSKKLDDLPISDHLLKDPAAVPIYWISRWVDYSEKYAFAYQLCDGSHGASYRDGTKLIMDAGKE